MRRPPPVSTRTDTLFPYTTLFRSLRAVLAGLEAEEFLYLDRREAPRATPEQIGRVHPGDFVDRIMRAIPQAGLRYVDGDTVVSPGSGEAALRAAGAVCAAIDAVMQGEADRKSTRLNSSH